MSIAQRIFLSFLLVGCLALAASAAVVINELFYDPSGTDTQKEFIELYNNGTADVDLTGWQIQWGGTTYAYGTYAFPAGTIIRGQDYLLLGGDSTAVMFGVVPDIIIPNPGFNFQNGGTETDAVRINDLLGYHDTCLYDWPNTYNLEGDRSNPADSLECNPDVNSGHSLSRITLGFDTNYATDWEDLAAPTPTRSQFVPAAARPISDLRANDSLGVPVLLDSLVTIAGIITCAAQLGPSGPAYMYDNTGAVAVYDNTVVSSGIAIGDSVRVTGWVGFFSGLTEVVDEPSSGTPDVQFTIISTGHAVTPIVVTPTYLAEVNEAKLVRINNAQFVGSGLFVANLVHYAYVGPDTFAVYIDAQTNIPGTSIPLGTCDLVGVIGQYDTASPYFEGYQLIPRSTSDIIYLGAIGPSISQTQAIPYLPDQNQPVVINSRIYDDVQVTLAEVFYNPGTIWNTLQLFDDGLHNDGAANDSIYGNTIPGFPGGTTVNFYIHAQDNAGNDTYDPANAPTTTFYYQHHDYSVITPISELRMNDSLGVPTHLNELVTIQGYVTATAQFGASGPAYMQSTPAGGAGIGVFDPVIATAGWQIGDQVKVTGWVGFYSGLTQLVDDPNNANYNPVIQILTTGNILTETWITDLDNIGEQQEGLFVVVKGVRFTATGNFAGNTNYWITCGADSAAVRVDADVNLVGTAIPTGPVNVLGIMSQFDSSSPYTSGYQLLPRFTTDIVMPEQLVTCVPLSPPIIIPATGGSFQYQADVYNNGASTVTTNLWMPLELPSGSYYQILLTPMTLTLSPGAHIMRIKTQNVPSYAPAGLYSFRIAIGTFASGVITAQDAFSFTKSATDQSGNLVKDWGGEWLADWIAVSNDQTPQVTVEILPRDYSLEQNYPNPFNPRTTIRFGLPEAQRVKLEVFNLNGQALATLVDGYREAGYHEAIFDAGSLSSGVYLVRLTAGDFTQMHKMMLVK